MNNQQQDWLQEYLTTGARPANRITDIGGDGFNKLLVSFLRARQSGLKNPKVHIGGLMFTLAKDNSRNPGHLYIKDRGEYVGKVSPAGQFQPYNCPSDTHATIVQVSRDPLAAAVRHGHMTGNCAVCSKALSDPESVTRGIGPVCAKRFGW